MIKVEFNKADLARIMFALEKVKSMAMLQRDDMQYYCAVEFHMLLLDNLHNERFKAGGFGFSGYAPLTSRYATWKGSSGDFWKLEGDLARNIVKRKMGRPKGWAVGVNDVMDIGGKSWLKDRGKAGKRKSIGMYAIVNEFGGDYGKGGKHPGRPLFRPTREEYAKDLWPKQGEKSLKKIGYSWS